MWDILGWVAGPVAVVLGAIGIWLTVRYGEQAIALLKQIYVGLKLDDRGNR